MKKINLRQGSKLKFDNNKSFWKTANSGELFMVRKTPLKGLAKIVHHAEETVPGLSGLGDVGMMKKGKERRGMLRLGNRRGPRRGK